ncbi:MAG: GT4 family glycosyltransferase PelF [Sulfurovum sp.]
MPHNIKFPKSDNVDIMLFSEGTYPYIKGGVSSWLLQLMKGLPQFTFGVCFIGAQDTIDGKKMKISYELPPNLKHLEVHYLFDNKDTPPPKKIEGDEAGFYTKDVTFEDFLFSKKAWRFIDETYSKNCPDIPFIDYFWTLRNIHKPIWILANIVDGLPKAKIFHSPSTGYAGFLGALSSYHTDRPFFLTEHGIYTRERKIDMFSADWIEFKKPSLLQQPEESNYIKDMWINFFDKIGIFCYDRSNYTLSLFSGAQKIQVLYGADENKTLVIPNGVDVEGLGATMKERLDRPKPIITLIGRVVPIKDIKTFIRAIKIASITIADIEGWIVGPVEEDAEYFDECQQMAISLGLKDKKQMFQNNKADMSLEEIAAHKDKIKFFGHSNIKEILPKSALQTLSSISEGMPLVILEGFAAGVPCVATDVGSCRDLIEGGIDEADRAIGYAGAIAGIANPEALAQEYIKFLDFDNGLWKKAQEAGLKRVNKYYTQQKFLQEYAELYQEALELTWEELTSRVFPYYMPKPVPYARIMLRRFRIVKFLEDLNKGEI